MLLKTNKRNIERATTPDGLHRVFGYGSLKDPKRTPVWCRGRLWLRPTGQAAVDFTDREAMVKGDVMLVDDAGLEALDRREGSPWLHVRVLVKLRDGSVAWAYQWGQDITPEFDEVPDGIWRWEHLRVWRAHYGANNVVPPPPSVAERERRSAKPRKPAGNRKPHRERRPGQLSLIDRIEGEIERLRRERDSATRTERARLKVQAAKERARAHTRSDGSDSRIVTVAQARRERREREAREAAEREEREARNHINAIMKEVV